MAPIGRDQVVLSVAMLILILSIHTLVGVASRSLELRYVATGSMEPSIPPGSLVLIRGAAGMDYMVGDVVLARYQSIPILHRVSSIDYDSMKVITRGDNRDTFEIMSLDRVEGVMLLGIPYIALPLIDPSTLSLLTALILLYMAGVALKWAVG